MIIADTSVWIDFFRIKEPVHQILSELLENRNILAIECIFGELLQGIKNNYEKNIITKYWENLPRLQMKDLFIKAGIYSAENNFISKGVGLIDAVILLSAIESNSQIWTLDKKLLRTLTEEYIYKY